jgi:hypothetical protein
VSEVVEAVAGEFDDETPLTVADDYWLDADHGIVFRTAGFWLPSLATGEPTVRVTYVGGYPAYAAWASGTVYAPGDQVEDAGVVYTCLVATDQTDVTAPADDATNWEESADQTLVPADLRRACLQQAVHDYGTRLAPGATNQGQGGGSVGLAEPGSLLPQVAEVCKRYRRMT